MNKRPHIVLVIPRGEAVRNFVYSDTLRHLHQHARVTVLSVVNDEAFKKQVAPICHELVFLPEYPETKQVYYLRVLTENAHDLYLWTRSGQNHWELRDIRARERGTMWKRRLVKAATRLFANRWGVHFLTRQFQKLNLKTMPVGEFRELFERIQPDLVMNCSHIHGRAGELPLQVAKDMGIPTAGFIFSWDNLTTRSRILVPYDHFLVWHEGMKGELLATYPKIREAQVHVSGTPQFDFHFNPQFERSRAELAEIIGFDPDRPFVLYTTGIDHHFYEEHHHVNLVISLLRGMKVNGKTPQLVVRTYIKGTSKEMYAIADAGHPGVYFPKVLWEANWQTPQFEDLFIYSNLLRHASLGINASSTVSLELMMYGVPVINLDFDPPGTVLTYAKGYRRHIRFDHYWPVAQSGAVMAATSAEDMATFLWRGLNEGQTMRSQQQAFLKKTFGNSLDGRSGARVAQVLLKLAGAPQPKMAETPPHLVETGTPS